MRTIAVTNHKGGSAKTTTAVNLAAALGEGGRRVLVIDLDPQGSASSWLGVPDPEVGVIDAIRGRDALAHLVYRTTAPGVELVPASPGLVAADRSDETDIALGFLRAVERLPAMWDTVIVDCPPSLGYLAIAPLTACQEVLIPVEAHVLALEGIRSLLETMDRIRQRLNPELGLSGVLACRVNRTSHARSVIERLERRFPDAFMRSQVRESIRLAEAPSFRLPITRYAPDSTGAEDYRAVAEELVGGPLIEIERRASRPATIGAATQATAIPSSVGALTAATAGGAAAPAGRLGPAAAPAGRLGPATAMPAPGDAALAAEPQRPIGRGDEPEPAPAAGPRPASDVAVAARRLIGTVADGWRTWFADEVATGEPAGRERPGGS
jgi:chromosome partitioning protein